MTVSIRQQLIDAIEARLETITVGKVFALRSGDYVCQNTIKGVYPWRKTPFNPHELPAIEFWDASAETSPGEASRHAHELPIVLQVSTVGSQPASIARTLMEDIIACIGSDPRWGGLARWTNITAHGLMVEKAGDVVAGAQILFTVEYRTPLWRM